MKRKLLEKIFSLNVNRILNNADLTKDQQLICLCEMFNESLKKHIYDELKELQIITNYLIQNRGYNERLVYNFDNLSNVNAFKVV